MAANTPSKPATLRDLMDEGLATSSSPHHTITTDHAPSTRSGHPPGTPKPPFDPPRRRSSLHFSLAISCSPPADTDSNSSIDMPASPRDIEIETSEPVPSNIGRRRAAIPITANVTPGHVAQMQRLFQSAKASLRMDMAFAASPTGSIGSRLPPTSTTPPVETAAADPDEAKDAIKAWRYSTAPGILLGHDRDVREPVPGTSPPLPPLTSDAPIESGSEPISSGFNSPILPVGMATEPDAEPGSSPPAASQPPTDMAELQGQLTDLRMDHNQSLMDMDESPLVARVKRLSADVQQLMDISENSMVSEPSDGEIFLSEPAKAAAASAKAKRGILKNLFHLHRSPQAPAVPIPPEREPAEEMLQEPDKHQHRAETPCPDPKLHELFARTPCPDPLAHVTPLMHTTADTDGMAGSYRPMSLEPRPQSEYYHDTVHPPMPPYSRASSTGSPMAFPKFKSPPSSPRRGSAQLVEGLYPEHRGEQQVRPRPSFARETSEHFQPGWYYTPSQPQLPGRNRNEYSFSTAAGKVGRRSAAPDSLIRDSYRTDTLTPLARPIGKYRKTGIAAMASAKGVSKYYGDHGNLRRSDRQTRSGTKRPPRRPGVQFRSSPPPQSRNMAFDTQKRPRPRDLEDDSHDDDSQALELDEETRAAIRLSLLAAETPESQHIRRGLRELSPNVITARGPGQRYRKKRRPSYWDGDLKEIRESPARRDENGNVVRGSVRAGAERKVMTSPPKDGVESVKSERVEIEVENTFERMSDRGNKVDADADGTMMQIERDMD